MALRRQRQLAFVRFVLFGPLLCSVGLGIVAAFMGALRVDVLAALAAATTAAWFLVSFLHARGRSLGWLLGVGLSTLLVVVPEMALRVGGFSYSAGVGFGVHKPQSFQMFVRDPELFWKCDPAKPGINSWGFRGPEVAVPKPERVFRILYLGDSCTQWGNPDPYPPIVERRLNEDRAEAVTRRVECVSLAVAGYTAHQGRIVAEKFGARVDPDVVVCWFGWNDHWLAYGSPDDEAVPAQTEGAGVLDALYRSSRLLQLVNLAALEVGLAGSPRDLRQLLGMELLDVPRVSPEEYRDNLLRMARIFGDLGVPVVFVTAPSAHRMLGTPRHFVDNHYAVDEDAVIDQHTLYVGIVREVAHQSGQRLLDLEREWSELSADELRELFTADGIHFEKAGCELVAKRLASFLQQEFEF